MTNNNNNQATQMITFKKAPIPFMGQKRYFISAFSQMLLDNIPADGAGWTIVDLFGGSGLLSHAAKVLKPAARVIYNDFDNYHERLAKINQTNQARRDLLAIVGNATKERKLPADIRAQVLDYFKTLQNADEETISAWFVFSGTTIKNLAELSKKNAFYHNIPLSDYKAEGYLQGVEMVNKDFAALLAEFKDSPKTLLICDPPYLSTAQHRYANKAYFNIVAFLKLADNIRPPFGSEKSEFVDYVDYLTASKTGNFAAFAGMQTYTRTSPIAGGQSYQDNMAYKF